MSFWKTRLRLRVKPLVYRLRNRLLYKAANFYVNAVDNDQDSDFRTNGEVTFARDRLRGAKLAFDVGAAHGVWTEVALAADPNVVVHCFEPTTPRFKVLCERNFGDRAILRKLGLGDSVSEATIFYNASGGSNSLFPQRYDGETYDQSDVETVSVTTIDRYCAEHAIDSVDFIKMDIEGFEMAALRGAEGMLRAGRINIVQFEYSDVFLDAGSSLMQVMNFVRDLNPTYDFYKIYPDRIRHIPSYERRFDNFKLQNWAFIKSDR